MARDSEPAHGTLSAEPGSSEPGAAEPGHDRRARQRRPFVVQVAALRKGSGIVRHEVRSGVVEGLASLGVAVPEGAASHADLELSSYPGGIDAEGTVRAPWRGECRRCGGPVEGEAVVRVRERFEPIARPEEADDAYPLEGDRVDLEPLVRDAILLELPLAPLCSDSCKGLCPHCGINRNTAS